MNALSAFQPPATQIAYVGGQHGNVVVIPAGYNYAGSTFQTVNTYPGQAVPAVGSISNNL